MPAFRILRPQTAFPTSGAKRKPRRHQVDHLAFIRGLPSVISGSRANIEAAHVRYTDLRYGKSNPGTASKPDDCWAVPLTATEHREQHAHGDEPGWWKLKGVDPLDLATRLWAVSGDDEAGELIIRNSIASRRTP